MTSPLRLQLSVFALIVATVPALAQESAVSPRSVPPDLDGASLAAADWSSLADSVLGRAVADGRVPGATVVVVNRDEVIFGASFGVASLESEEAVTDSTLFEVGSIGKVLTAIAVLQQVERGQLALDTDVNEYLSDRTVASGGEVPITLHHLLTHTAGLNDPAIGYAVRDTRDVRPLDEHLAAHFPTPFASPGRYVSYSNYGFGLAGYLVESVSRTPFTDYVSARILAPLGTDGSGYAPDISGPKARGYRTSEDGFEPTPDFHRPVTPAGSFAASARDMVPLLQALLRGGAPMLSPESTQMMTKVQFAQHEALMGNSYGLEESRWGGVRGFGKGGSIPGFVSFMAVIPEHGLGLFVAANVSSDDAVDRFVTAALSRGAVVAPDVAELPRIDTSGFAGEYRSNRYDRTSIEKLLRMEIHNIYVSGEESLALWHDGGMHRYRPVDELVFQNSDDANRFLVFETDERGNATHAFFNERFAGGYVPVVWDRNGFWNSNTYVNEYVGAVGLVALSYLLWPFSLAFGGIRRRLTSNARRAHPGRWLHTAGLLTSAAMLACVLLYFIPLLKARSELIFGMPPALTPWSVLPWLVLAGFVVFSGLWLRAIWRREGGWLGLGFGLVFMVSGVLVFEFFVRWNFL